MQKRPFKVIRQEITSPCYICSGTGKILAELYTDYGIRRYELCHHCEGTGKHIESNYIHVIDGKYGFQGDTLK